MASRPLATLNETIAETGWRPVEPRLSSFSTYAQFDGRRMPQKAQAILRAARNVLQSDAFSLNAQAFAHLANNSTDRAVQLLKESTARTPHDPRLLSDYAAALLVAARAQNNPSGVVDALVACDSALAIEPSLPEAMFNRAIALRDLGLLNAAGRAFRKYLLVDASSPWAAEAHRYILQMDVVSESEHWQRELKKFSVTSPNVATIRRLVQSYPQQARSYAESVWPSMWADAVRQHDEARASLALELAKRFALELHSRSAESLAADAAAILHRIACRSSQDTQLLAEAYAVYRDGRVAHSRHDSAVAERAFRRAEYLFERTGSPMHLVARYYVGSALFEQLRLKEAMTVLDELDSQHIERRGYRALAAQIGWERGLTRITRGGFSEGIEIFGHSRRELAALRESELVASFDVLLAAAYDFAHESERAWRFRADGLQRLSHAGNDERIVVVMDSAAAAASVTGEWRRALSLLQVAASEAVRRRSAIVAAHAWTQQAIAHTRLRDPQRVRSDLAQARSWVAAIADERQRMRAKADYALAEGALLIDSDPAAALERFAVVQRFAIDSDERLYLPRMYVESAKARIRRKDDSGARLDLERGLTEIERQRASVRDLEQRAAMFAAADEIFDQSIRLALRRGDDAGLFSLAERQRSRTLLDTFLSDVPSASAREPLDLEQVRNSLAANTALVEYLVTPDAVVALIIRPEHVVRIVVPVSRSAILQLVATFRRCVAGEERDCAANTAQRLSGVLIAPIQQALQGSERIGFIPDSILAAIPFAMLPYGRDALLGEREMVIQSPSATLLVECSKRARGRMGDATLSVSGSVIDFDRYPRLAPLAWADHEVQNVARLHAPATTLLGLAATPETVLQALPRYQIAHLAAHAVVGSSSALDSALLLARGPYGRGELRAADVATRKLSATWLVVLAGCGTADPHGGRDGVVSLATAFLEAGVPTVVASFWDVEDESAATVMKSFHRRLRNSDVAAALSEALRENRVSRTSYPLELGGVVVIGGTPAFVRK